MLIRCHFQPYFYIILNMIFTERFEKKWISHYITDQLITRTNFNLNPRKQNQDGTGIKTVF